MSRGPSIALLKCVHPSPKEKTMTKLFTLFVLLTLGACSHHRGTDSGSGYTHSDERMQGQTGIQEQQMSQGDPQIQQQTHQ